MVFDPKIGWDYNLNKELTKQLDKGKSMDDRDDMDTSSPIQFDLQVERIEARSTN